MSYWEPRKSKNIPYEQQEYGILQRFNQIQDTLRTSQTKFQHITKLIKLQQTYIQSQQHQITSLKNQLQNNFQFQQKVKSLQASFKKIKTYQSQIHFSLQETETKLDLILEKAEKQLENRQANLQKFFQDCLQNSKRKLAAELKIMNRKTDYLNQIGVSNSQIQLKSFFSKRLQILQIFKLQSQDLFHQISSQLKQVSKSSYQTQEISTKMADATDQRLTNAQTSIKNLQDFVLGFSQDLKTRSLVDVEDSVVARLQQHFNFIRRKVEFIQSQQEDFKFQVYDVNNKLTAFIREDLLPESRSATPTSGQSKKRRISNKKVSRTPKPKK